ncbi:thioredoxin domain-containing protein [Anaerocolumna sp. AGMB13025]|uniref:thioredoxin domain-containing protein n=1 Tax=Anaerocolumna sp. AGMB13025 TaxID=3039116 RepID=UPI002FE6CD8E
MAHESFEDQEVADYLNNHFVAIKVDKEERPDVDSIYMTVCQNLTGSGGWPLTIFMFPDQKPFFAGTYYPKRSRYNMPGILDLLEAVHEKWETEREELLRTSEGITSSLKEHRNREVSEGQITEELFVNGAHSLISHFDSQYGGFGRAPKFPTPHNLMFLLRSYYYKREDKALKVVEKTLNSMYKGGIFDHIGYGFSRYSTDSKWLVPHFEKMLYDNGLLVLTYLETYQITKKEHYKQIAEMTMEYVLRELTSNEGGFYCAQDADSEGVEGKYYVFTPEEIIDLLGKDDGIYFNEYYGITSKGNFEGKSIPNRLHGDIINSTSAKSRDKLFGNPLFYQLGIPVTPEQNNRTNLEEERIGGLRIKVLNYRAHRTSLHKDDKILTSWNGIMIGAFAKAYKILRDKRYLQAAVKAEEFIGEHLIKGDDLYVLYREGSAKGTGHIDDYAFYCLALIELYEATLDIQYLSKAFRFSQILIRKFFDKDSGGFYLYAEDAETLIHRPKEIYDDAIPSGNSVAAYVLLKLSAYTAKAELIQAADKQNAYIAGIIEDYPSAYCFALMALGMEVYKTRELICVLPDASFIEGVQELLSRHFLPDVTVLVKTKENQEQLKELAVFTEDYKIDEKTPAYYLCENYACRAPVNNLKELENLLIKTVVLV